MLAPLCTASPLNTLRNPEREKDVRKQSRREMAVRRADIRKQEETSYVALEASDRAPESREGDYVQV